MDTSAVGHAHGMHAYIPFVKLPASRQSTQMNRGHSMTVSVDAYQLHLCCNWSRNSAAEVGVSCIIDDPGHTGKGEGRVSEMHYGHGAPFKGKMFMSFVCLSAVHQLPATMGPLHSLYS